MVGGIRKDRSPKRPEKVGTDGNERLQEKQAVNNQNKVMRRVSKIAPRLIRATTKGSRF